MANEDTCVAGTHDKPIVMPRLCRTWPGSNYVLRMRTSSARQGSGYKWFSTVFKQDVIEGQETLVEGTSGVECSYGHSEAASGAESWRKGNCMSGIEHLIRGFQEGKKRDMIG